MLPISLRYLFWSLPLPAWFPQGPESSGWKELDGRALIFTPGMATEPVPTEEVVSMDRMALQPHDPAPERLGPTRQAVKCKHGENPGSRGNQGQVVAQDTTVQRGAHGAIIRGHVRALGTLAASQETRQKQPGLCHQRASQGGFLKLCLSRRKPETIQVPKHRKVVQAVRT